MKNTRLSLLGIGLAFLGLSISTWTPIVIISTHPDNIRYGSRSHEIAVDGGGNSYVTWEGYDGNDWEIYWVKIDNSGTPGEVLKISTHLDNAMTDDFLPQIAIDTSGNSYVAWNGSDGNNHEIYWVRIDASGTPGEVLKISTHLDNAATDDWLPQIAVDGGGNSYVTWEGYDGNDLGIYWVKIDSSGISSFSHKPLLHRLLL